jgi:hypothetical protein
MRIVEYQTIVETSAELLDKEVNSLIAKGYDLYGNPYATGNFFMQAVVKTEGGPEAITPGEGALVG